jgi:hypothetical protein
MASEQEEDIARHHSSITQKIFAEILNRSQVDASKDSLKVVFNDFLVIIRLRILGLRVCTDNKDGNQCA